jgi:hypothetical protein
MIRILTSPTLAISFWEASIGYSGKLWGECPTFRVSIFIFTPQKLGSSIIAQ